MLVQSEPRGGEVWGWRWWSVAMGPGDGIEAVRRRQAASGKPPEETARPSSGRTTISLGGFSISVPVARAAEPASASLHFRSVCPTTQAWYDPWYHELSARCDSKPVCMGSQQDVWRRVAGGHPRVRAIGVEGLADMPLGAPIPSPWCLCGWHALHGLDQFEDARVVFLGLIRGSGRIIHWADAEDGVSGWRAKNAAIEVLFYPSAFEPLAAEVRARYRVGEVIGVGRGGSMVPVTAARRIAERRGLPALETPELDTSGWQPHPVWLRSFPNCVPSRARSRR